jgi:hypothetical protein
VIVAGLRGRGIALATVTAAHRSHVLRTDFVGPLWPSCGRLGNLIKLGPGLRRGRGFFMPAKVSFWAELALAHLRRLGVRVCGF